MSTLPLTPERLAANQANAQHSTGPATPEGRERSAKNSRTHGLCSKDLIIQSPEEQAEFDLLLHNHLTELGPKGALEQTLFDELVAAAWNLRRIRRMEAALCNNLDPLAALDDNTLQTKLDRLARHQTRIERSYYRAIKELRTLQTERVLRITTANSTFYTHQSPLVNTREPRQRKPAPKPAVRTLKPTPISTPMRA